MLQFPAATPPRTDSLLAGSTASSSSEIIKNALAGVKGAEKVLENEASDEQQLKQVLGQMISCVQELVSLRSAHDFFQHHSPW
jgi:nitrogen-specific signal transduction histidine kinase